VVTASRLGGWLVHAAGVGDREGKGAAVALSTELEAESGAAGLCG